MHPRAFATAPLALLLLLAPGLCAAETMQEITSRLLVGYSKYTNPNQAMAEAASAANGTAGACVEPEPNLVETQIYVTKLSSIDQKQGTYKLEGFFRLWWNDARLRYNSSCVNKLVLLDGESKLWVPDFYFPPSVTHKIGAKNDGQEMDIFPNGDVYWSQRLRLTLNCAMHLQQMPWDTQTCGIYMGSYSQPGSEVTYRWQLGRRSSPLALDNLQEQQNAEWLIGEQEQSEVRTPGLNPKVQVTFTLERRPDTFEKLNISCIIFVVLSYLGCWVAPAAVPARVALHIITILVVTGQLASVSATIPSVTYSVWLLDFQYGCMMFNSECSNGLLGLKNVAATLLTETVAANSRFVRSVRHCQFRTRTRRQAEGYSQGQ